MARGRIKYEVEWCYELPQTPEGDTDVDAAKFSVAYYDNLTTAIAKAKREYPNDKFGSVTITEMEAGVDENGHREWDNTRTMHIESTTDEYGEADFQSQHY